MNFCYDVLNYKYPSKAGSSLRAKGHGLYISVAGGPGRTDIIKAGGNAVDAALPRQPA